LRVRERSADSNSFAMACRCANVKARSATARPIKPLVALGGRNVDTPQLDGGAVADAAGAAAKTTDTTLFACASCSTSMRRCCSPVENFARVRARVHRRVGG
jgi:hypothetical protein